MNKGGMRGGMHQSRGGAAMGGRRKPDKGVLKRVTGLLIKSYPVLIPIVIVCIVLSAVVSSIPAIFMQKVFAAITARVDIIREAAGVSGLMAVPKEWIAENSAFLAEQWSLAKSEILPMVGILIGLYVLSIAFITVQSQLMAKITQGFLDKMRCKMFDGMQNLPIKYFDTHKHGDIMSYYTNDIDTLRQLVSQSLPSLIPSSIIVLTVFGIMLWYSVPMTLGVLLGIGLMIIVSKKIGGGSAK